MTLVVCWCQNDEDLWCAADTRISQGNTTVTDTGAKIFIIPISYRSGGEEAELSHFTLGFTFCGATLPAQNTHAIASTLCQMMRSDSPTAVPSAKGITTLYAKVAEYVLRDLNSRLPLDKAHGFYSIIFGYCPVDKKLKLFELSPNISPDKFSMDIIERSPIRGNLRAIGSGAQEFDRQLDIKSSIGENRRVLDVFMQVVGGGAIQSVGGHPQIAIASVKGVELALILSQDDENPDLAAAMINGFNTKLIGSVDQFSFGLKALGLGVERVRGRMALRSKGLDPDNANITQAAKNTACFEAALRDLSTVGKGTPLIISETYSLEAPIPKPGKWYYGKVCDCGQYAPCCQDLSYGEYQVILSGNGLLKYQCMGCHGLVVARSGEIEPFCCQI